MARHSNGGAKPKRFTLLDLKHLSFKVGDRVVSVEEASDEEFDAWIRQYIGVGWSLEERRDALNFAAEQGQIIDFLVE